MRKFKQVHLRVKDYYCKEGVRD